MYFFYIDEAGSRDPKPKDGKNVYVLLAVGVPETRWKGFDRDISNLKLELSDELKRRGKGDFDLADCEIKSNWLRNPQNSKGKSPFLEALDEADRTRIADLFYKEAGRRDTIIIAGIIDKCCVHDNMTGGEMHKFAYQLLLERIQHYMRDTHKSTQRAVIVMDDLGKQLNRDVTLTHAEYQRRGNRNMSFPAIIEYPFFVRSELSNGVQLADVLAYSVYHAFTYNKPDYAYLMRFAGRIYKKKGKEIQGLKVWADRSSLMETKRAIETLLQSR
ncbi:MAG: DUF3800 domain-containing protein [Parvibaculales bacterium]